ncbi:hypothetical protein DAPPUDRAFT_96205 [Daphnia pulex]|uniref:Uncharacterized protein n=1 Tax=Daphnia pulex TaxID=6669 RepID=E9FX82_DAPPU|nr:hypothetical protein DAPPUDRAFT_96205 [Daphnia pulex]|eukprot:EFX88314.1 hypothetical protein DAPPUDRAFT_96205 [Daphnia pulex]
MSLSRKPTMMHCSHNNCSSALFALFPVSLNHGRTVRYKLLVSTIAQKLILLNQQTREFIAPSRSCVVCVDRLHRARDNQDQQRLDQEEEKNGEAKNDDVNSGMKLTDSEIVEEADHRFTAKKKNGSPNKRSKRNLFGSTDTIPRTKSLMVFSITRTMALLYLYYCKFASCLPKPSKTKEFLFARPIPIPSNVNLQKERHVKLFMQWSRGWTHPQQRQPAKGKARKTCQKEVGPIPRNFNLQKERAVRLSFTFEGHGDHYIKRVMQWCRGWVRTGRVSSFSSSYNSRKA